MFEGLKCDFFWQINQKCEKSSINVAIVKNVLEIFYASPFRSTIFDASTAYPIISTSVKTSTTTAATTTNDISTGTSTTIEPTAVTISTSSLVAETSHAPKRTISKAVTTHSTKPTQRLL